MLIFLFSGIVCHAQNCTLTPAQENQTFQFTNFSPTAWPIGQSTTVTLTGSWTTPPTPLGCNTDFISLQGLAAGGGNGVRDPNVTFSNIVESLSPLQTTFTATVSPAASYVEELYSVECVSSQGPSCPNYSEISGDIYLCPYSVPSISSVSPSTWVAGQTYNVTISGSNFVPGNIFSGSTANPGCPATQVYLTYSDGSPVTFSASVQSASTVTGVATPSASALAGTATIYVWTWENGPSGTTASEQATVQIVPAPCSVPTIASISPNVWVAGKTSGTVAITGTGFTTTAAATASCPATTATVSTPDGSVVTVSGLNVASATSITLKVAPAANALTEGATLAVSGAATPSPNADILSAPQIVCSGAAMQCNGETISGANASTQTVVVGQTITLTTTPTAATLAALPIPLAFANTAPTTWTVGGTNIASRVLGPEDALGNPTSATASPTVLTNTVLNTYWLYPKSSVPVTYQYCVSYSGVSSQCSPKATATFNVTGPTAKITASVNSGSTPPATGAWWVSPSATCGTSQYLAFGVLESGCVLSPEEYGIVFEATNVENVPTGGGTFSWLQLIDSDVLSGTAPEGVTPEILGTGLDTADPYPSIATTPYFETADAPAVSLPTSVPDLTSETRTISFRMFLLWSTDADPDSINVPIGYVTWKVAGTADQNTKSQPPWSLAGKQKATTATYSPSTDTGAPGHGLPVWTTISYNTPTTSGESVLTKGETEPPPPAGGEGEPQ